MHYTHCFWDLDGTIADSSPGITGSVRYALKKLNVEPPPAEKLLCFIGPPLLVGFSQFAGLNEEDSQKAVAYYRENYRAGAMLDCRIYDGIEDLLGKLQNAGVQNVLATCKPQIFAEAILKHFGLDSYFSLIAGAELNGSRDEKHQVIAYAAERLGLTDLSTCLMIGDRGSDVLGASHHGMDCAGVLWGFGSAEELSRAGAKILCKTAAELSAFLLESHEPHPLKTDRLELRAIEEADRPALRRLFTDETVTKTYMVPEFSSPQELETMVTRIKELSSNPNRFVRGIYLQQSLIGIINDVEIDADKIELGYALLPDYYDQGYATEALQTVTHRLLESGYRQILAGAFTCNTASIRVMEKCEMKKIDRTETIQYRGKTYTCVYYTAQKK